MVDMDWIDWVGCLCEVSVFWGVIVVLFLYLV